MKELSRRKLLSRLAAGAGGLGGLVVAEQLAERYGLVPPDAGTLYGAGGTLTYAAHRLLGRDALAREFTKSHISEKPFANPVQPPGPDFVKLRTGGFADWRLNVEGLVERRLSLSLADLKLMPKRAQITQVACEEGWSYIAEWIGTPLSEVLKEAGVKAGAKFVVYKSIEPWWWDSLDIGEALHPQTLVTYAMNDAELPVGFGGPLRLRVPRQLGYKSVKFLNALVVTDNIKAVGNGKGSGAPDAGYAWYAGI